MNYQLEISDLIKSETVLFEKMKIEKINAPTIGLERQALIVMENKKHYIDGLKKALSILQK
jgi:hypothetical protein